MTFSVTFVAERTARPVKVTDHFQELFFVLAKIRLERHIKTADLEKFVRRFQHSLSDIRTRGAIFASPLYPIG